MNEQLSERFRDVRSRIGYLDAVRDSEFGREYKRAAFELLDVCPGQRVLDVGCGTGDDVRALALVVGAQGCVVGIDRDAPMVDEARRRSQSAANTEFHEGDALALPFDDGSFDRVRADRVLQMLDERARLLAEMIRVTRPGGHVLVSNPGGGSELDVGDRELTRRILQAPSLLSRGGWSGVELPNLFKDAGLVDVVVRPYAQAWTDAEASDRVTPLALVARGAVDGNAVDESEAERWLELAREAGRRSRFTFVHTIMIVRGTVQ